MKKNRFLTRKTIFISILAAALSFSVILPAFASSGKGGGEDNGTKIKIRENGIRFELRQNESDDDNGRVRLNSESQKNKLIQNNNTTLLNVANTSETGSARISLILTKDNLYDTRARVKVENFGNMDGFVFEGWLMDNESGYKLSLGALRKKDGNAPHMDLNFREFLVNFPIYDKLVITKEALNDTNPNPANTILEANIGSLETNLIITVSALNGSNEVPPTNASTTAVGFGAFVINTAQNTLKFNISFSGLSGTETGAHIHGFALPGANAPILFTLPLGSPKVGVWNYSEAQESDILTGKTYINIHSSVFPDGEIHGQITP